MSFDDQVRALRVAVFGEHLSVEPSINNARGGNMGTGAVDFPDPVETGQRWAKDLGRKRTAADRAAWSEYGRRLSMRPQDIAKGWAAMEEQHVEDVLQEIFGRSPAWAGYSVPHIGMVKMQPSSGPGAVDQRPPGPIRGQGWGPVASFPFHTQAAGKVWEAAKKLIRLHPTSGPKEILRFALEEVDLPGMQLTPEDLRLLEMAIAWMQNGPPPSSVRSAGAPGGPYGSQISATGTARSMLP